MDKEGEKNLKEIERLYLSLPGAGPKDSTERIQKVLLNNDGAEAVQAIMDSGGAITVLTALACSYAEKLKKKKK